MDNQLGLTANPPQDEEPQTAERSPASASPSPGTDPIAIHPSTEEVTNRIAKDGISFIFESRSVSSVARFFYTPIDGTFADLELEIDKADPIQPADCGGIKIDMGGHEWPADSDEIERHFVSCEQVGDWVEARWQWKCGEELADFLYRFTISGKSFIVEIEGGNGKATGIDLGQLTGTHHPRLIALPYFNFGENSPHILYASRVFISSFLDWHSSHSSEFWTPDSAASHQDVRLNGGCTYLAKTDGKRNFLHERWLISVSRQFEEVLPEFRTEAGATREELKGLLWYNLPALQPSEEGYIEAYEQLRSFKRWGLDDLLINHPSDTWHDGDGNATLTLEGAPLKGGADALSEYLEAVEDLGYSYSLNTNYVEISPNNPLWNPEMGAELSDGSPAPASSGQYLLKPRKGLEMAGEHTEKLVEQFSPPFLYLTRHASLPPWTYNDYDSSWPQAASFVESLKIQHQLLAGQRAAHTGPLIGDGGSHWFYAGLLDGCLANQPGSSTSPAPLLVDFALRILHPVQVGVGLGTPEQFFGEQMQENDRHSRSSFLDRYLALTVAYGHAGLIPDPEFWGMPAIVKSYFMLHHLQPCYLGVPVASIHYHHEGNFLETTEALVSGSYEHSQLKIDYENGLQLFVNGGWEEDWTVDLEEKSYLLPPGSFLAHMGDDLLVYSADIGNGRIDFSSCGDYLYFDARGSRQELTPLTLDGAAVIYHNEWEIDILPLECQEEIEVDLSHFWSDRRLPPLRLLGFKPDADEPDNLKATTLEQKLRFQPSDEYYRFRITLPEWMVEPGR